MFHLPKFRLEVLPECESTNAYLWSLSPRDGVALLAKKQTAGHGRRGNSWWSTEGNLALSLGFSLPAGSPVALLTFLAGIALWDEVAELTPKNADLQLKWPNDLYLHKKKLAGMITEVRQASDRLDVVMGIGLNISGAPENLGAISLAEILAKVPEPEALAEKISARISSARFSSPAELILAWEKRAFLSLAKLSITGEKGVYLPLRLLPSGELEVKNEETGETKKLASEDVSLRFCY